MRPTLVIGLGNPLAGDDGAGVRVVEGLAGDPALAERADFTLAGDDLLGAAPAMEGRRHVILVDALLGDPAAGVVEIHEEPFDGLETRSAGAHALSVPGCVTLLKRTNPAIAPARFTLIGVVVDGVRRAPTPSAALSRRLPAVADAVRACLREGPESEQ